MATAIQLAQQTAAKECNLEEVQKMFKSGKHCLFVFAEWCGHCQKCKEPYDKLASEFSAEGISICKVNGGDEKNKDIMAFLTTAGLQIQGFPFFVCLNDGKVVGKQIGAFPSDSNGNMPGMKEFIHGSFK